MESREDIVWQRLQRRAAKLVSLMEEADLSSLPATTAEIHEAVARVSASRTKLRKAEEWVKGAEKLNNELVTLTPEGVADQVLAQVFQGATETREADEGVAGLEAIRSLLPKVDVLIQLKSALHAGGDNPNDALKALSNNIGGDLQKFVQTIRSTDAFSENALLDVGDIIDSKTREISEFIEENVEEPFGEAMDLLDSLESESVETAAEDIGEFLEEVKEKADDIREKGLDAMADTLSVVGSVQQAIDVVKAIP